MELRVDYDEMESLGRDINGAVNSWISSLEGVSAAVQTLSGSSNIKGQAADSVKEYFSNVHVYILAALGSILSAHAQNYVLYKNEYQSSIDTALHTMILQDEILKIQTSVIADRNQVCDVDIVVNDAINQVSDIVGIAFLGSSDLVSKAEEIISDITQLETGIKDIEDCHQKADFDEIGQSISALEQFIRQQLANPMQYKAGFSVHSLNGNEAFREFVTAMTSLEDVQRSKSDAIENAFSNEEEWQKRLYEERQREAQMINWAVTGLCILGSVAAIVATGGTAAPLVVATVSGVSGFISAGTQNITSQYVANGDWGQTDWGQVGKAATLGGVSGFVTGYVGASLGPVITDGLSKIQPLSNLLNSSSMGTRIVTNALVGSASEMIEGAGTRFIATTVTTGGDLEAAWDAATNVHEILIDGAIGGTMGGLNGVKHIKNHNESFDALNTDVDDVELPEGTWGKKPFKRGDIIDETMGNNAGHNYPVIDIYDTEEGTIVSVKSRDLSCATYQDGGNIERTIKKDIATLAQFEPVDYGETLLGDMSVNKRVLQIVVPDVELTQQQIEAINSAIAYGKKNGVKVIFTVGR